MTGNTGARMLVVVWNAKPQSGLTLPLLLTLILAGCTVSFHSEPVAGVISDARKEASSEGDANPPELASPAEVAPSTVTLTPPATPQGPVLPSSDPSTGAVPVSTPNNPSAPITVPGSGLGPPAAAPAPRNPKAISADPQATLDLSFDDIKFDMVKGAPFDRKLIYPDIERYQDRKIKIRGYILPGYQERGIMQFVLVRDNMECCFGPGAALYDCILVTMDETPINYSIRPITVEGTFSIEPFEGPDGYPLAIYRMQAQRAE